MLRMANSFRLAAASLVLFGMIGCGTDSDPSHSGAASPQITDDSSESFEQMRVQREPLVLDDPPEGPQLEQFFLTNKNGITVSIINFGAIVTAVEVPDRDGNADNVNLGFTDLADYFEPGPYFGAICGRYANRIAGGKFSIDGTEYALATNNGPNHLHGGDRGFDKKVWVPEISEEDTSATLKLVYVSADGEEGYPGNLTATVEYTLNDLNELRIEYTATSDKATPVNLTSHCYWNLAGAQPDGGDVLDHVLTLHCDRYLPVDETQIPTGELQAVAESPMDFTTATPIGARIEQVEGGYDHCYVVNNGGEVLTLAAEVQEPKSGRVMKVFTTEPGVQLYTGNFLDGSESSGGYQQHEGFCLECQHFPDSPNQSGFPSTILEPGQIYRQTTVYQFSVE